MRMPAYKQLRWLSVYFTLHQRTVFIRVSANVRYPNIDVFTIKPQMLRKVLPDLGSVDISVNALQRFKGGKLFGHLQTTEIAGVPYLVAVFKMFKNRIVEIAVGVGKEAYFNHGKINEVLK